MAKRGSVYCIANDTMPGIVKIGATLRNPEDRLNEARATTWAPSCFRIIAQAAVEDAFGTESALHALLAHRRFEARREFFTLTHAEARAVFLTVELITDRTEGASQSTEGAMAAGESSAPRGQWPPAPVRHATAVSGSGSGHSQRLAVSWDEKDRLRSWVESSYTHVPLREKDAGTKLDKLHGEYARAGVHGRPLGKIKFAQMLSAVYPGIGPHRNSVGTVSGLYLLR
jgi:hypothetical protein